MLDIVEVKRLSELYQIDEYQIIQVWEEGFTLEEIEEMLINSEL